MKNILSITAFLGAITILLGAFGAHSLQDTLTSESLKSFETGVRYQMYHVIVLIFISTYSKFPLKVKKTISFLFLGGIVFFSGSIYAITFGVPAKKIWFITPLGGVLFIIGWVKMGFSFLQINKK